MATTISRYLKLKIDDNLSADAKSNLAKIDELGAIFRTNAEDNVDISAKGNISLQPGDPAIGGSVGTGTITFGDTNNTTASVDFYSTAVRLRSKLQIKNGVSGQNTTFLSLAAEVENTNADLTFSLADSLSIIASRSIIIGHSGRLVFEDANQVLTNKTISGSSNTLSNISYSSLLLTGAIVNADVALNAAIVDTKLATISTAGKVSNSATTATDVNTPSSIVSRDGSGNFSAGIITATLAGNATNITATSNATLTTLSSLSLPGSQVSGDIAGNAASINGILPITKGGTGNDGSNKSTALLDLLPAVTGNAQKVLRLNTAGDGVEWYVSAGTGTVTSVDLSMPGEFTVTNNPITTLGTLTVSKASQAANLLYASPNGTSGVPTFRSLVEADIPTLAQSKISNLVGDLSTLTSAVAGKEPTITAGTTAQYWRGDKSWQTLDTTAVPENGSLYFTDSRAKTAAVVNSTAGSQTDQAASVSAMKSYVAAQGGGAVSYLWAPADGATKSITHLLNKTTISVTIYDENGEDILVDVIDRTSNDALSLAASVAPTGNWTVVIRP